MNKKCLFLMTITSLFSLNTICMNNNSQLVEAITKYQPLSWNQSWFYNDKNLEEIKFLIMQDSNKSTDSTPLFTLINRYEDLKESTSFEEIFNLLIENKDTINELDEDGENVLFSSINNKLEEKYILSLIKAGADIKHKNYNGQTFLMSACQNGLVEVVKLLIESGEDVNAQNDKYFVVHYALMNNDKTSRDKIVNLINQKK